VTWWIWASGGQPVYALFFPGGYFPVSASYTKLGEHKTKETPVETVYTCRERARERLIMLMLLITATAVAYFVDAGCSPLKKINWLRGGRKNVTGVSPDAPKIKATAAASSAFVTLRMCRSVRIFVPRCYRYRTMREQERASECVCMGSGNGGMREWARKIHTHILTSSFHRHFLLAKWRWPWFTAPHWDFAPAGRQKRSQPRSTGPWFFALPNFNVNRLDAVTDNLIIAPARQHNVIGAIFLPRRLSLFSARRRRPKIHPRALGTARIIPLTRPHHPSVLWRTNLLWWRFSRLAHTRSLSRLWCDVLFCSCSARKTSGGKEICLRLCARMSHLKLHNEFLKLNLLSFQAQFTQRKPLQTLTCSEVNEDLRNFVCTPAAHQNYVAHLQQQLGTVFHLIING